LRQLARTPHESEAVCPAEYLPNPSGLSFVDRASGVPNSGL
jgi:hypothetical protein